MSEVPLLNFDIIIAGGGTTGCVIAGRLAAADPSLSVLVIEAGPPTYEDLAHVQPARFLSHILPGSQTVRRYVGKESADLGGRTPIVPCGQCLGGGSSVNWAMYARAAASDYDDWETTYGNIGWSSKELLPLLQKAETYQIQDGKATHGYSGPLKVSYGGFYTNIGQQFLDVATKFDKIRSVIDDPNDLHACNAYARWEKWIDIKTGRRSDVPHNYIYNKDLLNLKILTGNVVKRIIFENNRAVGVEYLPDIHLHPDRTEGAQVARAKRLVVISAGAFGSPNILERSGIGLRSLLHELGLDTVVDLPGVGENYQDHNLLLTPYLADDEAHTLDGIIRNDKADVEKWSAEWLENGSGLMAHSGVDAGVKLRPSEHELKEIGPEFQLRWNQFFANAPDKPIMWLGSYSTYVGDPSTVPPRKYFCMDYFTDYPVSVGYVHITSAEDVYAAPDFDPKFLSCPEDLPPLRWGYKHGREISRRMPVYRGEYLPGHPVFPEGSEAICQAERPPAAIDAPKITYTAEDDRAIDEFIRKNVGTTWHSLGTCAMKPRDQAGVVDARLNVYGVQGLKVADLSIAPANVSANTYSTAVVIGEKAAAIIAQDLGIDGF